MKSVLLSVKPKWCELIASRGKTVEVRKNKPKINLPFKCYIYETKNPTNIGFCGLSVLGSYRLGKVIGEFVCDYIRPLFNVCVDDWSLLLGDSHLIDKSFVFSARMSEDELKHYANGKYPLYAWHISKLVIYEKPKELNEFSTMRFCRACADGYEVSACGYDDYHRCMVPVSVTRPPQSWCYVVDDKEIMR